jgi:hypothetical protein
MEPRTIWCKVEGEKDIFGVALQVCTLYSENRHPLLLYKDDIFSYSPPAIFFGWVKEWQLRILGMEEPFVVILWAVDHPVVV